jgi:hypothetical protein
MALHMESAGNERSTHCRRSIAILWVRFRLCPKHRDDRRTDRILIVDSSMVTPLRRLYVYVSVPPHLYSSIFRLAGGSNYLSYLTCCINILFTRTLLSAPIDR